MDFAAAKDFIGWAITILGVGIVSVITGVILTVKNIKTFKSEVQQKQVESQTSQVDLTKILNDLAAGTAVSTLDVITKLNIIYEQYSTLMKDRNDIRIELSSVKLEVDDLRCVINNQNLYITALIKQMEELKITPIRMEDVPGIDYMKIKKGKNDQ